MLAVAVAGNRQRLRIVQQPIEDGGGENGIAKQFTRFGTGTVGCDDGAAAFIGA